VNFAKAKCQGRLVFIAKR